MLKPPRGDEGKVVSGLELAARLDHEAPDSFYSRCPACSPVATATPALSAKDGANEGKAAQSAAGGSANEGKAIGSASR
jgi:hypothetical protein